jgi:hypothetical protein
MRGFVLPAALLAALAVSATPLAAQKRTRTASLDTRPQSSCQSERLEQVTVGDSQGRTRPALDSLAAVIAFWFRPDFAPSVRNTAYTVVVTGSGIAVEQQRPAGDTAFDRVTRQAIDAAGHEHAFSRFAPETPGAPVAVAVHFGEDLAGRQLPHVERSFCLAEQRPDSPRPSFPQELTPNLSGAPVATASGDPGVAKTIMRGEVDATFVVDSAGQALPETLQILSSSHEAFSREVKRILPMLRYYPAQLSGRPTAQVVTQHFEFSAR